AENDNAAAALSGLKAGEANTRQYLETEYLRMFEARATEDIAKASEAELTEQVNVTEAQVKAGALTNADLLRVKAAAAGARQQAIVARSAVVVSRSILLSAVGLPPDDESVEFVEPTNLLSASSAPARDVRQESALALSQRHEVTEARHLSDRAEHVAQA